MPLLPGRENISRNIKELIASGKSRDQAIAIALDVAKKRGKMKGKKHGPKKGGRKNYS